MLAQIGITPDLIDPADIDESHHKDESPRQYALRMAREKAEVAKARHPGCFIIAADTIVVAGKRILHKPVSRAEAEWCWKFLPGRRHTVMTAVALVTPAGRVVVKLARAGVSFRVMSEAETKSYLDTNEWDGKAGAYSFQGKAARFIRDVQGNSSTIIGLPLYEVSNLLASHGYHVG